MVCTTKRFRVREAVRLANTRRVRADRPLEAGAIVRMQRRFVGVDAPAELRDV